MDNLTSVEIQNNLAVAEQELAQLRASGPPANPGVAAPNYAPGMGPIQNEAVRLARAAAAFAEAQTDPAIAWKARVNFLEGSTYAMRQELEKRGMGGNKPSLDDLVAWAKNMPEYQMKALYPAVHRQLYPREWQKAA